MRCKKGNEGKMGNGRRKTYQGAKKRWRELKE